MRVAVLVSCPVKAGLKEKISRGAHPQQDYLALAEALDAALIAPMKPWKGRPGGLAKLALIAKPAWEAFRRRAEYDLVISDMDRVGMALAFLLKVTGSKKRHIVICHGKAAKTWDLRLMKTLGLASHIHRFVCYGPLVAERIRQGLGLPEHRVVTVRHAADHRFWRPTGAAPERLIVSAGALKRDYPTLIEAVKGMDVKVVIAASSPWVAEEDTRRPAELPPNVTVTKLEYQQLRDLYARALFVAVPLHPSGAQSGSLVIYEAMAMGKAVVATRTEGQEEMAILRDGETGFYVPPYDVEAWRSVIQRLLDDPFQARRLGERCRTVVEGGLNMEAFVRTMVDTARSLEPSRTAVPS